MIILKTDIYALTFQWIDFSENNVAFVVCSADQKLHIYCTKLFVFQFTVFVS